jgi:signal transduction histidine kinase/DNA-binding response OmpR family regulator/CHASE3 domain sensor protein
MTDSPSHPTDLTSDANLARRLNVAIYVPLALLAILGVLLYAQVARLSSAARWMDHSDRVIAKAYEVEKLMIDQETGIRGYLVTRDPVFLDPFNAARPGVSIQELSELVPDPAQHATVEEVRRQYMAWSGFQDDIVRGVGVEAARQDGTMRLNKKRMDDIRAVLASLLSTERDLRAERVQAVDAANSNTRLIVVGLLVAAGAIIAFSSRRQIAAVAAQFGTALARERETRTAVEAAAWVRVAEMRLTTTIQGDLALDEIGARVLAHLTEDTGARVGAFYVAETDGFRRYAAHALEATDTAPALFARGEALVGQVGVDNKLLHLSDVPADFLRVRSGTGAHGPVEVVVVPGAIDGVVAAVVELGFLTSVPTRAMELLRRVGNPVAVTVRSAAYRKDLARLLEATREQADRLQVQQEELLATNEELEEQSRSLKDAQKELELQQVELEQTNESLERHGQLLARQNDALTRAQEDLTERAEEVRRANQFKSEFLANMSHELRTPLNSSLILAKLLSENKSGNLTPDQIRFAETIYSSGNDLLLLINDILDLSKIEAGKMDVHASVVPVARLIEPVERVFEPLVREKDIAFDVVIEDSGVVETDVQRAQQILKNLLSNAIKFTEHGTVAMHVSGDAHNLRVAVSDTGIGIAPTQRDVIFQAFRQADGTSNRKYGGTGLGLSISRDLARLLGGDVAVTSELGSGSTFVLTLPRVYTAAPTRDSKIDGARDIAPSSEGEASARRTILRREAMKEEPIPLVVDDRDAIDRNKRLVLIVEDDPSFARILADLSHELDFQCVVAGTADEGVRLAAKLLPRAILLDMNLPDHSGLSVLDRLKRSGATRHIPVHVISVADYSETALSMGASGYALKPVRRDQIIEAFGQLETRWTTRTRRVLVVEDDDVQRDSIERLLASPEVETVAVATVEAALGRLRETTFDCVVTDLHLPDASGYDLLDRMAADDTYAFPPVIVYTGRSLTSDEEQRLRKHSSSIIVKGARSPERLLDEVTLFLHQVESALTPERQRMLRQVRDREAVFDGRTVLIVEDDVRNIFALTSVLEPKGATIEIARNGVEALRVLSAKPKIDLVLMDIMMPEMDGVTCIVEIRKHREWAKLPIIALTAKAMTDDRERCLEAGANDYASKPLDVEMLLSLLRVWMPK